MNPSFPASCGRGRKTEVGLSAHPCVPPDGLRAEPHSSPLAPANCSVAPAVPLVISADFAGFPERRTASPAFGRVLPAGTELFPAQPQACPSEMAIAPAETEALHLLPEDAPAQRFPNGTYLLGRKKAQRTQRGFAALGPLCSLAAIPHLKSAMCHLESSAAWSSHLYRASDQVCNFMRTTAPHLQSALGVPGSAFRRIPAQYLSATRPPRRQDRPTADSAAPPPQP
jgi:hypothetical protein